MAPALLASAALSVLAAAPDNPLSDATASEVAASNATASNATASAVTGSDVTDIVVTARRRSESLQDVPIAISVVDAEAVTNTGAFNIPRLTQLVPSLQFYSQNPRNTSVNIRGIGAPLGLTNDGIEQGVGIYIDQVYYARVAATSLDFVDIQQIEVLRGPQGTLYGKNTTAGAINITTRPPSFDFEANAEISAGNLRFRQAKASVSGPLTDNLAARLSLTSTNRRGTIYNVATDQYVQELDNFGIRGTLLWQASDRLDVSLYGDWNLQDGLCCAQIFARVGATQRPLNRQFDALAAAFGYEPPSRNAFDRVTDVDAQLSARNEHGGVALRGELQLGAGTLTSITAWRFWNWGPANDRDFTGLPITTRSQNPSRQDQFTQEVRYAWATDRYDVVTGLFFFHQKIRTDGVESQGPAASRWTLNPGPVPPGASGCLPATALACIPAVLDNLVAENNFGLDNTSVALFGKLNWKLNDRLVISPGLRINYDDKFGFYDSVVTGTASDGTRQLVLFTGPYRNDPWIVAQRGIRAPQSYEAEFREWNVSGDISLNYRISEDVRAYGTYARAFKSGGINLNGVPLDANGVPILSAAPIKPESVNHLEAGLKAQFLERRATLNLAAFRTSIGDYQANVNNAQLGLLRGYLANADKVRVQGLEADFSVNPSERVTAYVSGAFTDGRYVRFVDAPCPPELSGGGSGSPVSPPGTPGGNSPPNCDISGQWLPGISRLAFSWGMEGNLPARVFGKEGEVYLGYDASARSRFSSNASRSIYLDVDGYSLHNFRFGFRTADQLNLFVWLRNAFDAQYYEQLAVTPGNTGLVAGQPADPRTVGVTANLRF
jgi:iron complex outermembrane receptor protein